MSYKLNLGVWGSVFAVPSCVVDNYIRIADGDKLKVLLYLLKNPSVPLRAEDIGAMTGVPAHEAEDALIFWENTGILARSGEELAPPEGDSVTDAPAPAPSASPGLSAAARVKLGAEVQFPPKEIAEAVRSDEAFRYLIEMFEKLSGRPTKHTERNALMLITEETGMPCEVALMLVEYCFSIEKATPAYMKSVAKDWMESGIDSITKAEERIKQLKSYGTLENRLHSAFGLTSSFSRSQKDVISGWAQAKIPAELIEEAYDVCMRNTGKLNFSYMQKVLKGWTDKGITTAREAREDKKPREAGASFSADELKLAAYAKYKKRGDNT